MFVAKCTTVGRCWIVHTCFPLVRQVKMENKAMYLSTYEERENGTMYEEAYEGRNLSKLHLCDEGKDTWIVTNEHKHMQKKLLV